MTSNHDFVILAAGRNDRLAGLVPAGLKPALLVDGESLLTRLLREVKSFPGDVTLVVAPGNAALLLELVAAAGFNTGELNVVVQPVPLGPGEAVKRALPYCRGESVVVLCGDNMLGEGDLARVMNAPGDLVIGGRPVADGAQLTVVHEDGRIVEKGTAGGFAWLGPLKIRRDLVPVLLNGPPGVYLELGGVLWMLGVVPTLVRCDTHDIGTPEALRSPGHNA